MRTRLKLEPCVAPLGVAQTLRETLDRFKLLIDALNMPPGDVNALLASLRYRLLRRMEAAGLQLRWQADLLPHWEAGEHDDRMRHLRGAYAAPSQDLRSMHEHAAALGAVLNVSTTSAGACLQLVLPLKR